MPSVLTPALNRTCGTLEGANVSEDPILIRITAFETLDELTEIRRLWHDAKVRKLWGI
jgi:hypothetical protein